MNILQKVDVTPIIKRIFRGTEYMVVNPLVGSLVAIEDNGFGSGVRNTYVVTSTTTSKEGYVTSATIHCISKIEGNLVIYDRNIQLKIKPYFNEGYARWNTVANHSIQMFTFDKYVPCDHGYHK